MTKDEALRLALEALQSGDYWKGVEAVNAIHKALEQPEPEPVAWMWLNTAHFRKKLPKNAEKGAWNPLYTSPPKREPLTDEQVLEIAKRYALSLAFPCDSPTTPEMFARAIEEAHGIKE